MRLEHGGRLQMGRQWVTVLGVTGVVCPAQHRTGPRAAVVRRRRDGTVEKQTNKRILSKSILKTTVGQGLEANLGVRADT